MKGETGSFFVVVSERLAEAKRSALAMGRTRISEKGPLRSPTQKPARGEWPLFNVLNGIGRDVAGRAERNTGAGKSGLMGAGLAGLVAWTEWLRGLFVFLG